MMSDKPALSLLVKLGSIAVHADELTDLSPNAIRGHGYDKIAIKQLLADPEVSQWLDDMRKLSFLPVKR